MYAIVYVEENVSLSVSESVCVCLRACVCLYLCVYVCLSELSEMALYDSGFIFVALLPIVRSYKIEKDWFPIFALDIPIRLLVGFPQTQTIQQIKCKEYRLKTSHKPPRIIFSLR